MSIALLLAGLVLLTLAGDALVRGAIAASDKLHIPPIIVGLTVVAFGTSAPELVVSLEAALKGAPGIAVGNVIGSNIANILLVLGLPAIITPIILLESGIRRSSLYMLGATLLLTWTIWDGTLNRLEGMVLFAGLIVYLVYSGIEASRSRSAKAQAAVLDDDAAKQMGWPKISVLIVFGIAGLALGGKFTTEGAIGLAEMFGVGQTAIGLTIVALGTSLPELATSIAAAIRRESGVVVGNVIGSNIFNILGIAGLTAMLVPLDVSSSILSFDIWVLIGVTVAILPIALWIRNINRIGGGVMVLAYLIYTAMVLTIGSAG